MHRGSRRVVVVSRAILMVACLLLLSSAHELSQDGNSHDLVARFSFGSGGVVQSALVAEEPAGPREAYASSFVPAEASARKVHSVETVEDSTAASEVENAGAAATTMTMEPEASSSSDTTAGHFDLSGLSDEELKTLLSDKKKGQVNFKRYKDRNDLVEAIREVERKEVAQQAFRSKVAAAARWYAETQEELKWQRATARRAKASRIKRAGDIPASLRSDGSADLPPTHELRVLYSEANGYGRHFTALVKDLESLEAVRLPNRDAFRFLGVPYPITKKSALLGQTLQVCFFGVLALAIVPDLVPFIPEAGRNMVRTRRSLIISTAFMLNMLGRTVLQGNAFEVYLDDELIYSTLKLGGRLPTSEMVSNMLLERTLLKDYASAMSGQAAAAAAAAGALL